MDFLRKLPIPMDIKAQYPLMPRDADIKASRDEKIAAIFRGESKKLLLIIGPCSADREDAVMEYLYKLADLADEVKDKILIIPRVYCAKPRTSGEGYMGMLHQPDPLKKPDMLEGLISIRKLHLRVLAETGLSSADEMLYPENHRYLSDLLSYTVVGARSVENQQHRLTASGLSIPVGLKNPTGGDLRIMLNGVSAAQASHTFIYRGWEVVSEGNPLAHGILRGYIDGSGNMQPNYGYDTLCELRELTMERQGDAGSVIVDANHCNSAKQYLRQIDVVKDVLASKKRNPEIDAFVKGLMIESYLEDGAQTVDGGRYGCSITDPCLGWEKSHKLVLEIADALV